jgi:sugar phosphate isomerase/epimerase
MEKWATGIFSSIGAGLGADLDAVNALNVPTVHLHAPGRDERTGSRAQEIKREFAAAGVEITVVFVGFPEDDYSTVERVVETVGLVPEGRRLARVAETLETADFAADLGVGAIGMHFGFIPSDTRDPEFAAAVAVAREICDHCATQDQTFNLETGQETARELLVFIEAVERENLAVNFDPANMILYGSGEPLEALDLIGRHVKSVHCKDAKKRREPDQPWHADAPLGSGDVNIERFLLKLKALGYVGPLTVEREYSADQQGDIEQALNLLLGLREKILGAT